MPCISRDNLLVSTSNIHETVDTGQNISEVIKDTQTEHPANSGNIDNIGNANTIAPVRAQRRPRTVFVLLKIPKIRLVPNIVKFVKWMKIQVKFLSQFRSKNLSRPIIGHININFLESKFEALESLIKDTLDMFVVTETKIDESYPTSQFKIEGFGSPFRLDGNKHVGGIMVYIREHLPCKLIQFHNKPKDIEAIIFELTLRNKKWIIMGAYNPAYETIPYVLDRVIISLDKSMANYDNILILGDHNSLMSDGPMKNFCELYNLENLIKEPTCYKNPDNPRSIDVILTNSKNNFHNSMAIETGLSDHQKMVITVLKNYCKKRNLPR